MHQSQLKFLWINFQVSTESIERSNRSIHVSCRAGCEYTTKVQYESKAVARESKNSNNKPQTKGS